MTIKSNTPAHDKDCWQTPLWLFDALDIEFGFWLDSAASDKNALCAHWLTEADDALNSEWISHGAIWNNPPYSNIRPWVEKAAEQCIQQRQTVVMRAYERHNSNDTRTAYPDTRKSDRSGEDAFLRKRNSAQVQPRQQRRASRNS